MKKTLLAAMVSCCILPFATMAATLEQRISTLEDALLITEEEVRDLHKELDTRLIVAGYADVEYIVDNRASKEPGFRLHHLSLFFKQQINEKWRFFSEIEYEDAPLFDSNGTTDGKIFVEAVNIDFQWRPGTNFRAGRFFTPAGIWSIDHYPPYVPTQERPQHIRKIFPQLVNGVMAYGTVPVGENFVSYELYSGNGEGNTGHNDDNSEKAVGLRITTSLPYLKQFDIGASYYHDTLNDDTLPAIDRAEKTVAGGHVKFKVDHVTVQAEYADANMEPAAAASYHMKGYYLQTLYDFDRWTIGYRYDFYASDTTATEDLTTNSLFVNYHVSKDVILKLEFHDVEDDDISKENYTKTIASIGINLGN